MNESIPGRGAKRDVYAAVDLGSNSFHLLVARREHGQMRALDRIKDMVRLGAGLDEEGRLDEETRARAVETLASFGQRLRGIPPDQIRAVGTQTLRRMQHADAFLLVAETALGCPVDVIAGREEARLVYLGVSQDVPGGDERRLVIDIGGGSTELAAGIGLEPRLLASLQFGCVSVTRRYFADGRISRARWRQAAEAVQAELQELKLRFRRHGWTRAIGSSGTIRAVHGICGAAGWSDRHITPEALRRLRRKLIEQGHCDRLRLDGLSSRRQPVLAGGVVVLEACFEALELDTLAVSRYALREGLLFDLLGRLERQDPRDTTVRAFMLRYEVDPAQARRVRAVARRAFRQMSSGTGLRPAHGEMLDWAAMLHETGLTVSHSEYQRHSGYLVEQSDMAGFSRQEQQFLAALVRHHRRAIPGDHADTLPDRLRDPLRHLLVCLRIAWVLCRTRQKEKIPRFRLECRGESLTLRLPRQWIEGRALTARDLDQETEHLKALGFIFRHDALPEHDG